MSQIIFQDQGIDNWNLDQLMKSQLTHKSQTLTFWSTLNFKDQDSSRHSKISNLIIKNQESQEKSTKSQDFQDLEKF